MKNPSDKHKAVTAAKIVAGLAATAALCLNVNGCVYGPEGMYYEPPTDTDPEISETTTFDPEENESPTVYGPPSDETFDPEDNQNADVYGPPEFFESETSEDEESDDGSVEETEGSETSESSESAE